MIAAAVLTKEEVVLEGCPKISDVEDMAEIVRSLAEQSGGRGMRST